MHCGKPRRVEVENELERRTVLSAVVELTNDGVVNLQGEMNWKRA